MATWWAENFQNYPAIKKEWNQVYPFIGILEGIISKRWDMMSEDEKIHLQFSYLDLGFSFLKNPHEYPIIMENVNTITNIKRLFPNKKTALRMWSQFSEHNKIFWLYSKEFRTSWYISKLLTEPKDYVIHPISGKQIYYNTEEFRIIDRYCTPTAPVTAFEFWVDYNVSQSKPPTALIEDAEGGCYQRNLKNINKIAIKVEEIDKKRYELQQISLL